MYACYNVPMKKISAIIACYKDEQAIPLMYLRLSRVFKLLKIKYEIIFVNDGSPDHTDEVLSKLAKKDAHVVSITHSRNFSSQMAFTSGMKIAQGDAVVLLDGDLQDPPELIEQFYHKWQEGYDVVYGIRTKREAPLLMQIAYKLFYRLFHKLSYITMPLDAGDFSLIDRKIVTILNSLPERDRFVRGLRAWVGFKQTGIPYNRHERVFGTTTNNVYKNFNWATKGIFSFSYVPLQLMTSASIVLLLLSTGFLFVQLWRGASPLIGVLLCIGSVQLMGISVLGEYIGKIFEEVKQRPGYIVKKIIRNRRVVQG